MAEPVPSRRDVLRAGGVAGAAILGAGLAGCSDDEPATSPTTTAPGEAGTGSGTDRSPSPVAGDLDLAVAAVTLENSAVTLYGTLLEVQGPALDAAGLRPLLERFRDHHVEHAAALNGFLEGEGLDPVPPDRHYGGIPPLDDAELADLADRVVEDLVGLLTEREDQLTQSYIDTLPRLTHGALRLLVTTVGAIEARHVAAFDLEAGGVARYLERAEGLPAGRYPIDQSLLGG